MLESPNAVTSVIEDVGPYPGGSGAGGSIALDPLAPAANSDYAMAFLHAGRHDNASSRAQNALDVQQRPALLPAEILRAGAREPACDFRRAVRLRRWRRGTFLPARVTSFLPGAPGRASPD